jgi:hypothetical protein
MHCAIIGQSNSILRAGYFSKLLERSSVKITKSGRLGGSSSVIGPYFGSDEFFADSEFCIIDLCVVDFASIWGGVDYYHIMQWVDWIGHKARKNGCQPIFVLIPTDNFSVMAPLLAVYEAIIRQNRYFYIDMRIPIKKIIQDEGLQISTLYKDGSHPGERISTFLADALSAFFENAYRITYHKDEATYAFKEFEIFHLVNYVASDMEVVEHSSSLLSFKGVRLRVGQRLTVPIGRLEKPHAIMVNSAACNSKVALEGSERLVKSLNLRPYSAASFEGRLVAICSPLKDRNHAITIEIAGDDEACQDRTLHEATEYDRSRTRLLEISDLLIEKGTRLLTYQRHVPAVEDTDILRYSGT